MRKLVIIPIRLYQLFISPMLGRHCRFIPTCSCYAIQAIQVYGVVAGGWMAVKRVLRCHPWHPGGYDPVLSGHDRQCEAEDSRVSTENNQRSSGKPEKAAVSVSGSRRTEARNSPQRIG